MTIHIKQMKLFPPSADKCQCCAVVHAPDQPHDATSLYYSCWFAQQHGGRPPTWEDAMAHCDAKTKKHWTAHLCGIGISVKSTSVRGGITTTAELNDRLANKN
jgi:hypothetical protein